MRQQYMETFSETNKRKDNAAGEQTATKRRKSILFIETKNLYLEDKQQTNFI